MRPRLAFVPSNNMWGGQGHARDHINMEDWARFPVILAGMSWIANSCRSQGFSPPTHKKLTPICFLQKQNPQNA